MDDKARSYLDAMKSEAMTRLNDSQEELLKRHRTTAAAMTELTGAARATNTELARSPPCSPSPRAAKPTLAGG